MRSLNGGPESPLNRRPDSTISSSSDAIPESNWVTPRECRADNSSAAEFGTSARFTRTSQIPRETSNSWHRDVTIEPAEINNNCCGSKIGNCNRRPTGRSVTFIVIVGEISARLPGRYTAVDVAGDCDMN